MLQTPQNNLAIHHLGERVLSTAGDWPRVETILETAWPDCKRDKVKEELCRVLSEGLLAPREGGKSVLNALQRAQQRGLLIPRSEIAKLLMAHNTEEELQQLCDMQGTCLICLLSDQQCPQHPEWMTSLSRYLMSASFRDCSFFVTIDLKAHQATTVGFADLDIKRWAVGFPLNF